MKKLIIWDFDGVIADSEKLWVKVWRDVLAETKGIKMSDEKAQEYLPGVADRTRKQRIEKLYPDVELDDAFMDKISEREIFAVSNILRYPIRSHSDCIMGYFLVLGMV